MHFSLPILAAGSPKTESQLFVVLVQLILVIAAARLFSTLFRKLNQPGVVGEIAAGLFLGPSLLGKLRHFEPTRRAYDWVFDPAVTDSFAIISQLGLVFLLFLIGLEFDFGHLRNNGKTAFSISIAGIILPFALGAGLGHFMHGRLLEHVPHQGFVLFMGTAMAITALPVLGRMLVEWRVGRTRVATLTITAAASDDACGWILLAAVSALAGANFQASKSLIMIAMTAGFGLAMIYLVRPAMKWWIAKIIDEHKPDLTFNSLAVVLIIMLLCALATSTIGIFAIFGAFMFGAILSDQHAFRHAVQRAMGGFLTVFFLPIFFTYTGLRTDIGTLDRPMLWVFATLVLTVAIVGKFGGCTLAARLSGLNMRDSVCVGVMMNTRGLMELVVVNQGYNLGVIPKSVFCMLVIMALVTTIMTTPILLCAARKTELEPGLIEAGFLRPDKSHRRDDSIGLAER